jgi:pyruvate dehydrogenase E1 component alpha subunit
MGNSAQPSKPFCVVAPDGSADERLVGALGLDDDRLRELYRLLRLARSADRQAAALQRQGQLAVYGPLLGQEAAQVGSAFALGEEDFVFPAYRELGVAVVRGLDLVRDLYGWKGILHGSSQDPRGERVAPNTIPIASHIPHAVGWAMGARLDRKRACAFVYFGDGATSEGDFHEGCNFASVFRVPVVFFCQNNQYAISVPLRRQTGAPIHRKAEAYGFPGVWVDGNDVLAVYRVAMEAVERARNDYIPTLIEAVTYRVDPHSTADDPRRYRTEEEEARWRSLDPIDRYYRFLSGAGLADDAFFEGVETEARRLAATIRDGVASLQPGPIADLLDHVFAERQEVSSVGFTEWESLDA